MKQRSQYIVFDFEFKKYGTSIPFQEINNGESSYFESQEYKTSMSKEMDLPSNIIRIDNAYITIRSLEITANSQFETWLKSKLRTFAEINIFTNHGIEVVPISYQLIYKSGYQFFKKKYFELSIMENNINNKIKIDVKNCITQAFLEEFAENQAKTKDLNFTVSISLQCTSKK